MDTDILIIGAGASGLAAACEILMQAHKTKKDLSVTLIDRNALPGRKLALTGNGRCNLLPAVYDSSRFHGSASLASAVLGSGGFGLDADRAFFEDLLGLKLTEDDGRLYPLSDRADSVVRILTDSAAAMGAVFIFDTPVTGMEPADSGFLINGDIRARRVIIASGGLSFPGRAPEDTAGSLLDSLGVGRTPLFPSLTALKVSHMPAELDGVRVPGTVGVWSGSTLLAKDAGEVQFTKYGISGIVTMQVSRAASVYIAGGGRGLRAQVDCLPGMTAKDTVAFLSEGRPADITCAGRLCGLLPYKLAVYFLRACAIDPGTHFGVYSYGRIQKLVTTIHSFSRDIDGVRGWDFAQVTAGGIPGGEIDPADMSLRRHSGVYVCGEVCDVDGDCGGNNLFWAWSSGRLAGRSAALSLF